MLSMRNSQMARALNVPQLVASNVSHLMELKLPGELIYDVVSQAFILKGD